MTRVPIRVPPSRPLRVTRRDSALVDKCLDWFDGTMADQRRVFETNLRLAIDAGEIINPDEDEIDALLREHDLAVAEGRERFLAIVIEQMTTPVH